MLLCNSSKNIMKVSKIPSKYLPVQSGNRNTRRRCEICTKLTMKTSGRCQRRYSVVFSVNFEQML